MTARRPSCPADLAALRALATTAVAALPAARQRSPAVAWAAARTAVVAAARARVQVIGSEADGALFAREPAGADRAQTAALRACADVAWPSAVPPPSFARLGELYPELLATTARKRSGAWFTAPVLALPTARRALQPWLATQHANAPTVCDPAVGSGAFLCAALALLAPQPGHARALVAAEQLHGVDLDATAAHLAARALHEACGATPPPIAAIDRNVCCGDGLTAHASGTFDVVLGNPPWETLQDERRQRGAAPRAAVAATFAHQGRGKRYTYRLFVERAVQLLRTGGRLGLIVPASLWFDRDAAPLRALLLQQCRWEWLYALDNRERLFAIDGRYRFGPIVVQKGGRTTAVRAAFGRRAADWAADAPPHVRYRARDVAALSPHGATFVELGSARELRLLQHLHAHGQPLLGPHGACSWRQGDFNMTADRGLFVPRAVAERRGCALAADGSWRSPRGEHLRPLWQGAMLANLQPNAAAFAGGSGRAVRWRPLADPARPEPQYLVDTRAVQHGAQVRTALRALSNATNERTAIACLLADEPCGNSLGVLVPRAPTATPVGDCAFTAGVLASLVFDWALRLRLAGTNLNGFVLADTVVPRASATQRARIATLALRLCATLPWHAALWRGAAGEGWLPRGAVAARGRDLDAGQRRRLQAELDATVAHAFGLAAADFAFVLRDCQHSVERLRERTFTRALDPKGFWRIDRELPPAQRGPQLALAAFARGERESASGASAASD